MNRRSDISPPRFASRFLRWFCHPNLIEDVEGDLSELFSERASRSRIGANLKYILDILLLFRPGIIKNFEIKNGLIHTAMIKNYLKIALRNALRYKGFTALNLLGLIIGLVSSFLILLWVQDEVQMDKFHVNGDRIYQVFRNMKQSGGMVSTTWTIPKPAADLMRNEYPEVDDVAQVSWPIEMRMEQGDNYSNENGFFATPNFLSMFSFEILEGNKDFALNDLNAIVISRTIAEKYFGSKWKESAVGSTLRIDGDRDAKVTAVFENIGSNSSLQFDWLAPAEYFFNRNDWVDDWGNGSFRIYFTIDEQDLPTIKERVYNEIITHAAGQANSGEEYLIIHKFQDYYLYSNFENGVVAGGRIDYVKIMTVVAIFILLIASINFMNLATARSGRRSKEIGLRKVMGAHKSSLSSQFFLESILLSTVAMLISVLIVWLLLPDFNQLVDKRLFIDLSQPTTWYFLLGVTIMVGVFSGLYPAVLLPTFGIIQSLKGSIRQSSGASYFRKALVVFQFGISTLLIIGTSVIYSQLDYVLNKDLGLDKENLVAIQTGGRFGDRLETFRNEVKKIPEVKAFTATSGNPINYGRSTSSARWDGMSDEGYEINILLTDEYFVGAMGMEVIKGRDFEAQLTDSTNFLINEVMADLMGFDDPLNRKLSFWGIDGNVVGVVKNFHMQNMHEPIAPLILTCIHPAGESMAMVRIQGDPNDALKSIEKVNQELNPGADFEYEFVDQAYAESYQSEMTVSVLARIFAGISIFISCLGLFGLSAFTADQRSKEIGVRKVHGASLKHLVLLLSKDYSILMIIAFVLALPFAYYYSNQWLEGFEFRTDLNLVSFLLAGVITFAIGAITVSFKSYQAARVNPVKTLKDE